MREEKEKTTKKISQEKTLKKKKKHAKRIHMHALNITKGGGKKRKDYAEEKS